MIVLSAKNISKSYGTNIILQDLSFQLNHGDKVGIIGANGAGKTTLLNILTGQSTFDEGDVFIARDVNTGYLKQRDAFDPESTVYGEMLKIFRDLLDIEKEMETLSIEIAEKSQQNAGVADLLDRYDLLMETYKARNGFSFRSEITGVLSSMAFLQADLGKKIRDLSGGEKTRLSLTALLLLKPQLLFLDEPTNHLDIGSLMWLEQYLKSYNGTVMAISHDRFFLDQIAGRIFELEHNRLTEYDGNYSEYVCFKQSRLDEEIKLYERQDQEVKRQEEIIRRFKQHGTEKLAKRARSREKRLNMLERREKPVNSQAEMKLRFQQLYKSGNEVLLAEDVSKGFGGNLLFKDADIHVKSGEHICMVGANGIGKTTLLKILKGELQPDHGWVTLGHNVSIGYYDQEQRLLDYSNTVLQEMNSAFKRYSDTQMRNILGAFLFRGDMVFQDIRSLSGGEKARLSLLKLMLSGANLLLLDEPTNHLDIMSKEVFEKAMEEFPGAALIVSHDRYLLRRIPDRIVELTSAGLVNYLGDYDYYLEKKEQIDSGRGYLNTLGRNAQTEYEGSPPEQRLETASALARQREKASRTEERRKQKELTVIEDEISRLEMELNYIESKMCHPEVLSDYQKLGEYGVKHNSIKMELDCLYKKWMNKQDV